MTHLGKKINNWGKKFLTNIVYREILLKRKIWIILFEFLSLSIKIKLKGDQVKNWIGRKIVAWLKISMELKLMIDSKIGFQIWEFLMNIVFLGRLRFVFIFIYRNKIV